MATPTSGTIKLSEIAAEYGGSAPHSLSEYYGSGHFVPSSGQIKSSDFYSISAISFVSARRKIVSSSTSVSAEWPSGTQAGDIIFATGHRQNSTWGNGQWPPSGWTDLPLSTNSSTNANESTYWQHNAYIILGSAQTNGGTAWTRTQSSNVENTTIMWCFRPTGNIRGISLTHSRGIWSTDGTHTVGTRSAGGVAVSIMSADGTSGSLTNYQQWTGITIAGSPGNATGGYVINATSGSTFGVDATGNRAMRGIDMHIT